MPAITMHTPFSGVPVPIENATIIDSGVIIPEDEVPYGWRGDDETGDLFFPWAGITFLSGNATDLRNNGLR